MLYPSEEIIQVWENDSGPIPPSGVRYAFVAYIDPEHDAGLYGYGMTEREAIEDYIRNMAEALCNGCTEAEGETCQSANDCVLVEPNFSAFIRQHMPEDDQSHREWREFNGARPYERS